MDAKNDPVETWSGVFAGYYEADKMNKNLFLLVYSIEAPSSPKTYDMIMIIRKMARQSVDGHLRRSGVD